MIITPVPRWSWCCDNIYHTAGLLISYIDIGRTAAFLLLMSNFKSETSFGFLIKNNTGHVFWILVKPQNGLAWPVFGFWKRCFPGGFMHSIDPVSSNWMFYWVKLLYAHCVCMTSSCLLFFITSQELLFRTGYHVYARALKYRQHADYCLFGVN